MNNQQKSRATLLPAISQQAGLALRRKCACGTHTTAKGECEECGRNRLRVQRVTGNTGTGMQRELGAPAIVHEVLRSTGRPLDPGTRAFFEPRFGHDLTQVRVHTDSQASESARAVNALAYTVGNKVVFGAGQFAPNSPAGRMLLAHELTHVIQQQDATHNHSLQPLQISHAGDTYEREADRVAAAIVSGDHLGSAKPATSRSPSIQRSIRVDDLPTPPATAARLRLPVGLRATKSPPASSIRSPQS